MLKRKLIAAPKGVVKRKTKIHMQKDEFNAIDEKLRLGRTLEGIAYYACVHSPNMTSVKKFKGEPYYIVNLGLDKESELEKAKSWGLEIHEPQGEIKEPYVKIKRKIKAPKTADNVKVEVVDTAQNAIPPSILIGNGSRVRCKFTTYWFDNNGGGVGTGLYKVQVVDLIRFVPKDRDFVSDGSGFTLSSEDTGADLEDAPSGDDSPDDFADVLPWDEAPKKKASGAKASSDLFD